MWGRQAYVGLEGGFGAVMLGRQNTPHYTFSDNNDPMETGAGSAFNSGILSTIVRANNAVKFETPSLSGIKFTAMQTAGEGVVGGKITSAQLEFSQGAFTLGGALLQADTPEKRKFYVLAGTYNFNVAKVFVGAQKVKNSTGAVGAQDDRKEFWAGVHVPVAPSGEVHVAYYDGKTDGVSGKHASQWSAGYIHALSKRTNLYAVYSAISNGNATAYSPDAATGGGVSVSNGVNANVLQIGVRHKF